MAAVVEVGIYFFSHILLRPTRTGTLSRGKQLILRFFRLYESSEPFSGLILSRRRSRSQSRKRSQSRSRIRGRTQKHSRNGPENADAASGFENVLKSLKKSLKSQKSVRVSRSQQ